MGSVTKGITKAVGGVPIIGNMAKSVDTLVRRPGDFAKDPMQLVNLAATLSGVGVLPPIPIGGTLGKVLFNPASPLEKIGNVLLNQATGGMLPMATGQGKLDFGNVLGGALGGLGMAAAGNKNPMQAALEQAFMSTLLGGGGLNKLMQPPSDSGYWGQAGKSLQGMNALAQQLVTSGYGGLQPLLGKFGSNAGVMSDDPYGLAPVQQRHLNRLFDSVSSEEEAAVGRLRQNLAMRGISDPAAAAAAEARIRSAFGQRRRNTADDAAQQAFQQRQAALQQMMNILGGLGSQGAGLLGQTASGQAMLGSNYANRDLGWQGSMGSLFGMLMSQRNPQPQFPQLNLPPVAGGLGGSMTPQAQQGFAAPNTFGLQNLFKYQPGPTPNLSLTKPSQPTLLPSLGTFDLSKLTKPGQISLGR